MGFIRRSRVWLLTLLAFALIGGALTTDKSTSIRRVSDKNFTQLGDWKSIKAARYSEGHASFSKSETASLKTILPQVANISSVSIRYYDYGDGKNTIRLLIGEAFRDITYGGSKGVRLKRIEFNPPVKSDAISLEIKSVGQPSVLIDHLSFETSSKFDVSRVMWQIILFSMFVMSIWLASFLIKAPNSSSGKIYHSIDILRGVGVVLVVMLHASGYAALPDLSDTPLLGAISKHGHYGVEIFYVVSAYTLTYSLASSLRKNQQYPISMFWNRRFNRIVPTLLFCLLAAVLFQKNLPSGYTPENTLSVILKYLSMGYVFDREVLRAPIGHTVWWSISTEFQFYILMPLLFLPIMTNLAAKNMGARQRYITAILIVVGGIFVSAAARGVLADKSWLVYTVLYHFDAFAIGIGLAIMMMASSSPRDLNQKEPSKPNILQKMNALPVLFIYGALILGVAVSEVAGKALPLSSMFVDTRLFVIMVCGIIIFLSRQFEDRGVSFSSVQWLRTLGLLSFIVYLVHIPVLQVITRLPVPAAIGADTDYYFWVLLIGLSVSALISVIVHWVIEQPSLRLNSIAQRYPQLRIATTVYVCIVMFVLVLQVAKH